MWEMGGWLLRFFSSTTMRFVETCHGASLLTRAKSNKKWVDFARKGGIFFKRFSIRFNPIEWENRAGFAPKYLSDLGQPLDRLKPNGQ
jgi:hypothetical protein